MPRRRYPKISQQDDGTWNAWVTTGGKRANGRPIQRHIKRATKAEVEAEIDRILDQKEAGAPVKPGRKPTFKGWMTTYLDTVAPRRCDPGTIRDYRSLLVNWAYPVCGDEPVDRVAADHLDKIYNNMAEAGRADSYALKMHRVLTRALEIARRRHLVSTNVAKDVDPPTFEKVEIQPLDEDAANAVLDAADGRRNSARWSVGLALGTRQGEALGLRWDYVDLDDLAAGEMRVWWQLRRRSFVHGCGDTPCGRKHGGHCPDRKLPLRSGEIQIQGGLILKPPKSRQSKRTIPIPPELVAALRAHREVQELEKMMAGGAYTDRGFVFAELDGSPIDPAVDRDEWVAILQAAGVPHARVHDGRHTAATLLLAQGVPIEVVQEILGHSDIRVTRGYTHVASGRAREATDRMGRSLLKKRGTP
jgi:integrase